MNPHDVLAYLDDMEEKMIAEISRSSFLMQFRSGISESERRHFDAGMKCAFAHFVESAITLREELAAEAEKIDNLTKEEGQ